eukprot:Amastigsp_a1137_20.p7 type:complete len:172 gc:universal Amastigsp_a1137_20:834-319(-)
MRSPLISDDSESQRNTCCALSSDLSCTCTYAAAPRSELIMRPAARRLSRTVSQRALALAIATRSCRAASMAVAEGDSAPRAAARNGARSSSDGIKRAVAGASVSPPTKSTRLAYATISPARAAAASSPIVCGTKLSTTSRTAATARRIDVIRCCPSMQTSLSAGPNMILPT